MTGDDQQQPANVPNPMIQYLTTLKGNLESALGNVPDIESPTGAVGAGTAWTGTRAKAVHADLAGIAPTLRSCLTELPQDVQDAIDSVSPKKVTAIEAKLIRVNMGTY